VAFVPPWFNKKTYRGINKTPRHKRTQSVAYTRIVHSCLCKNIQGSFVERIGCPDRPPQIKSPRTKIVRGLSVLPVDRGCGMLYFPVFAAFFASSTC
jgi:hypothetical protein